MRRMAALAAVASVVSICPVAHADPIMMEDHYYTNGLSESGVNYQGRVSTQWMKDQAHATCALLDQNRTQAGCQAAMGHVVQGRRTVGRTSGVVPPLTS